MKKSSIQIKKSDKKGWQHVDYDHLEFGKISTDHMFVADYFDDQWQNPRIIPFGTIQISPFTSALHYGQTVFEGIKAYRRVDGTVTVFRPKDHLKRFNRSLERMCMPQVPERLFLEALKKLLKTDIHWVPEKEGASLYIRPFMFAIDEKIGVQISNHYRFMMVCSPVGAYYSKGLKVKIERTYARAFPGGTGFTKCGGNYGVSFYPFQLAQKEGFDQVLWTDAASHRFIEESGTMNIGFIVNDIFITPVIGDTILAGITRDSVLEIAKQDGMIVEERCVDYYEIISAFNEEKRVEAFGMGTAATIAPIREISVSKRSYYSYIESDAVMFQLKQKLNDIRLGRLPDDWNWNWVLK